MGKIAGDDEQEKSQLATEICDLLARANLHFAHANRSPFINWYLVLRVSENADTCSIRKQYHKLALKLHPDKNKHSKAETAFKLVSQAYFCLSDNARRAAFDSERKRTFSCNMKIPSTGNDPSRTNVKIRKPDQETFSRSNNRVQRRMKELQSKLRDEATIIEKCVIANATASRREVLNASGTRSETPIFNPSGYHHDHHQYQGSYGYPHQTRTVHQKRLDDLRAAFKTGNVRIPSTATNGSPVFQCRSETTASFRTRCATSRNH